VPQALLGELGFDTDELHAELGSVAVDAQAARDEGLSLAEAVQTDRFEALRRFHTDLRDALLVEIPSELRAFVSETREPTRGGPAAAAFGEALADLARTAPAREWSEAPPADASQALAELLVFEAVRLRLLVAAWQSDEFERLGGTEADIDAIASHEVQTLLADPALASPDVRPLPLLVAAASVSLAADATERAQALRRVGDDVREELTMQARLRKALRELRLPESVLLSNALSGLLGETRQELVDLQRARPVALGGLSRQAMDQRVSRGRKALTRPPDDWPRRKHPALVDLWAAE